MQPLSEEAIAAEEEGIKQDMVTKAREGKRRHAAEEPVTRVEGPLRKAALEEGISFKNLLTCHIGGTNVDRRCKEEGPPIKRLRGKTKSEEVQKYVVRDGMKAKRLRGKGAEHRRKNYIYI